MLNNNMNRKTYVYAYGSTAEQPAAGGAEEKTFDRNAYAEKKKQERADTYALIDSALEKLPDDPALFRTYLDVQAKFERLSVGNALLITAQRPEATVLMDFEGWKQLGASVKKGENGIMILAPGSEYERKDGSTGVSFTVKRVFDVSQTNGAPESTRTVYGEKRELLSALLTELPCDYAADNGLPEGVITAYRPDIDMVMLRRSPDENEQFRSLAQEAALLRMTGPEHPHSEGNVFSASCAAYLLCRHFGVEAEKLLPDAVPETFRSMGTREFRKELNRIRETSEDIADRMEHTLRAPEPELAIAPAERDEGAR